MDSLADRFRGLDHLPVRVDTVEKGVEKPSEQ
jgi:hypothetical protein